ncbi:MAG: PqqD family protein [Pseudomonadota bacterium]
MKNSEVSYTVRDDVVFSDVQNGIALLDLDRNVYFTLNGTGAVVWRSLEQPKSIDDLAKIVSEKYGVDTDQCLPDISALIDQLVEKKLVRVSNEASA